MATTANLYGNFLKTALNKEIDWDNDTIKLMLCTALTIDQDNDVYLADVAYTEASGVGYTAGGQALTFLTTTAISYNAASNTVVLDADDVSWDGSTLSNVSYGILYDDTPATNKPLIGYLDFGGAFSTVEGSFKVIWSTSGVAALSVG